MRDKKRIKPLLKTIKKAWKKHPDLRLCQLIANCFPGRGDLCCVEDATLLRKIKEVYEDKNGRRHQSYQLIGGIKKK